MKLPDVILKQLYMYNELGMYSFLFPVNCHQDKMRDIVPSFYPGQNILYI